MDFRSNAPDTTYGIEDRQQAEPICWCECCGGEIYFEEGKFIYNGFVYCQQCFECSSYDFDNM